MAEDLDAGSPEGLSAFLKAVGDYFGQTGEWPEIEGLQRDLYHQGLNLRLADLRPKLDPDLGEVQSSVAWLTLRGLHDAGRLADVDDYITAIGFAHQRYADPAIKKPEIRSQDLDALGFDSLRKKKVLRLLQEEGQILAGGGTTEDEQWHYDVNERVRDYSQAQSYETYMRVRPRRTGFFAASSPSLEPIQGTGIRPTSSDVTPTVVVVGVTIRDRELLQRCADLLRAGQNHDRAIREATVVLEDRVRRLARARRDLIGTSLMERAFGAAGGKLRLREDANEQRGAMELFRGTSAFFRNETGHRLVADYGQEDALEFVAFVDLLLTTLDRRKPIRKRSGARSQNEAGIRPANSRSPSTKSVGPSRSKPDASGKPSLAQGENA